MERPVTLITGGAKRVGRAIARQLAMRGCDVALTYHASKTEADDLILELEKTGVRACAIRADFSEPPEAVQVVADAFLAFGGGRVDALVNSASVYQADSAGYEVAQRMWKVNFISPLLLSRALADGLRRSRGCVVNMCDILAERPARGWLAYCGSKAALLNATVGLARELAPEARCVGISPGVVDWPTSYTEEQKRQYLERVPLGRAGTPEEVGRLVEFLMTDGAYITGQVVRLDGGRAIAP